MGQNQTQTQQSRNGAVRTRCTGWTGTGTVGSRREHRTEGTDGSGLARAKTRDTPRAAGEKMQGRRNKGRSSRCGWVGKAKGWNAEEQEQDKGKIEKAGQEGLGRVTD